MSLWCQLSLHLTRNSLSRLRWDGKQVVTIIIIIINVFFGEERKRKLYTYPFSHDTDGEFQSHLGVILGSQQVWQFGGQEGLGFVFCFVCPVPDNVCVSRVTHIEPRAAKLPRAPLEG